MRLIKSIVLAGLVACIAAPAFAADHHLGTSRTHATQVKKKAKKDDKAGDAAGEKKEGKPAEPAPAPAPAPQK